MKPYSKMTDIELVNALDVCLEGIKASKRGLTEIKEMTDLEKEQFEKLGLFMRDEGFKIKKELEKRGYKEDGNTI